MTTETISQRATTLVRRLVLKPGMATPWHVDPFHRMTVVVCGEALAVNVGRTTYEEVAIFLLDRPDAIPLPIVK